jgi:hypothetical protein
MLRRGLRWTWLSWRQHGGTEMADTRRHLARHAQEKRSGGSHAATSRKLYWGAGARHRRIYGGSTERSAAGDESVQRRNHSAEKGKKKRGRGWSFTVAVGCLPRAATITRARMEAPFWGRWRAQNAACGKKIRARVASAEGLNQPHALYQRLF